MPSHPSRIFAACVATALAGCSGSSGTGAGSTAGLAALPQTAARSGAAGRIYSSSYGTNAVEYFDKGTGPNNPVAGSLTGTFEAPQDMTVDSSGNLYVANGNAQNVLVYAPGASAPATTLSAPDGFPDDVVVAPNGTVYAANLWGTAGNPGTIEVYSKGATSPTSVLRYQGFSEVVGVALDHNGNVFVSFNQNHETFGAVEEFRNGNPISTKIKVGTAGGIGFDPYGHMLLIDRKSSTLNVYDAGSTKPKYKLPLPGAPIYFKIGWNKKMLYVANFASGEIDAYDYTPAKLTLRNTITNGMNASSDNLGIALSP
jgi:sugar lactone lactonase YvrE